MKLSNKRGRAKGRWLLLVVPLSELVGYSLGIVSFKIETEIIILIAILLFGFSHTENGMMKTALVKM